MSDLVKRLRTREGVGAAISRTAATTKYLYLVMDEAADELARLRSEVERLTRERDGARGIVEQTYWMALRYADGRKSYAVGMCNDAVSKAYSAGWLKPGLSGDRITPLLARDGMSPEWQSIETRAQAAETELATLTARTREVLAPFAELDILTPEAGWRDDDNLTLVAEDEPSNIRYANVELRHFRAANTLFNELKEKVNG